MRVKLGRLAHACIGAAIVFGGRQGFPFIPDGFWFFVASAVGLAWEFLLQRWVARLFPWFDPRPNAMDWAAFPIGAAAAMGLISLGAP